MARMQYVEVEEVSTIIGHHIRTESSGYERFMLPRVASSAMEICYGHHVAPLLRK